jgi:hypothetical protein
VRKCLRRLADPPETHDSLRDDPAGIIQRKVARHEPFKATRGVQVVASRLHFSLRMPGLDAILKPTLVDYESRPYEMGWILHAWPTRHL